VRAPESVESLRQPDRRMRLVAKNLLEAVFFLCQLLNVPVHQVLCRITGQRLGPVGDRGGNRPGRGERIGNCQSGPVQRQRRMRMALSPNPWRPVCWSFGAAVGEGRSRLRGVCPAPLLNAPTDRIPGGRWRVGPDSRLGRILILMPGGDLGAHAHRDWVAFTESTCTEYW